LCGRFGRPRNCASRKRRKADGHLTGDEETRGSSSHSRYYRTQPRGHEYIIYHVIYVVQFLRALSNPPPKTPSKARACIFDVSSYFNLAVLLEYVLCVPAGNYLVEISVTHDKGEVPCWSRRGERKFKGMVREGWILDRVFVYVYMCVYTYIYIHTISLTGTEIILVPRGDTFVYIPAISCDGNQP